MALRKIEKINFIGNSSCSSQEVPQYAKPILFEIMSISIFISAMNS